MTERGRGSVQRDASHLAIGPSALAWDGDALTVDINEVAVPLPARIRGQVRVHPAALTDHTVLLDAEGRHRWTPLAPHVRVEVVLERPALRWAGTGYFDTNAGDGPLEDAFTRWDWSRAPLRDGTAILYDVARRDGGATAVALRIGHSGAVEAFDPPPPVPLPRTHWRVARATRADADGLASVARTLEDTPFYARSVLRTQLLGERTEAMHESLALDRFAAPWVQAMLPFRIPRALR